MVGYICSQVVNDFLHIILYVGSDFTVPGGFNVTITFGSEDDSQPFPLEILEDMIGEGKEVIKLLLTRSVDFDVVRPGHNHTTTIMITDNDLSTLTPYKPKILCDCCLMGIGFETLLPDSIESTLIISMSALRTTVMVPQ